jgi:hypothetical protein
LSWYNIQNRVNQTTPEKGLFCGKFKYMIEIEPIQKERSVEKAFRVGKFFVEYKGRNVTVECTEITKVGKKTTYVIACSEVAQGDGEIFTSSLAGSIGISKDAAFSGLSEALRTSIIDGLFSFENTVSTQ